MNSETEAIYEIDGRRLRLLEGDITEQRVDAIVNAANSGLRGGGGVDGAIHRAGGPSIMEECRAGGGCPTGDAVVTGAGDLDTRHVIHAVGPRWKGGAHGEAELLASAYRRSMERAEESGVSTIAFPSLSTGAYGYPIEAAAPLALRTVADALRTSTCLAEARFVLFGEAAFAAYRRAAESIFGSDGT